MNATLRPKRKQLIAATAEIAVMHSGGRLRLACNAADDCTGEEKGAGHFLKLDRKRIGRDVELYAFMMEVQGDAATLADFIIEVLMPIKAELPEAYRRAGEHLKTEGRAFVPPEMVEAWNGLF
jgi:hypothetical protein